MASAMPDTGANEAFIKAFGNPVVALGNFDLVRYFAVMSVTLVLYDRVLTFPVELKRIWSGHISKTKFLYVVHQELTLGALVFNVVVMTTQHSSDEDFCRFWMVFQAWMSTAIFTSIAIIFTRRLYDLYNRDRHCLMILVLLILAQTTASIALLAKRLHVTTVIDRPGPWFYGCFPDWSGSGLWRFWIPPMVFQLIATGALITRTAVLYRRSDAGTKGTFLGCALRNGLFEFMTMTLITFAGIIVRVLGPASLIMLPLAPMTALASILGCRLLLRFLTMSTASPVSFNTHPDGANHIDVINTRNQPGAHGGIQFTSHLTKDSAVSSVDFDLEKGKGRAQEPVIAFVQTQHVPPAITNETPSAVDLDQWRPPANQGTPSVAWADNVISELGTGHVTRLSGDSALERVEEEGSSMMESSDGDSAEINANGTEGGRAVSISSDKSSEAESGARSNSEVGDDGDDVNNAGISTSSEKDNEQIRSWLSEGPTVGSPITTVPEEDEEVDDDEWFEKYDEDGRPKRTHQRRWKSDETTQPYFRPQTQPAPQPAQPTPLAPRRAFSSSSATPKPSTSKPKEPYVYHSPRHALGLGRERGSSLPFSALLAASNPTPTTKKFGDWSSPRSRARSVPKPEPAPPVTTTPVAPRSLNPKIQLSLFMQRRLRDNNLYDDQPAIPAGNMNDLTPIPTTSTAPLNGVPRPPSPTGPRSSAHFPRSPTYTAPRRKSRPTPPSSSQSPHRRRLRQLLSNNSSTTAPPSPLDEVPSQTMPDIPAPSLRGARLTRVTSRGGESISSEYETATICSASTGWMFEVDASTAMQTEDLGTESYGFGRQVTSPYS